VAKKRGNGEGSVYPRRNKHGRIISWRGSYVGPDGKRRYVSGKTRRSAEEELTKAKAARDGGGSIAWIDPAGSLRNGPQSAGSDPGPACYGRGGDDFQKGGDGNDFIDGSKGDDTIVGGTGRDHVSPAAGNDDIDSVDGIAGNDTVGCGDGNDTARVDRDTAPDPDVTDHYFDDCEDVQFVNVGG
jgi:hypothetical protein